MSNSQLEKKAESLIKRSARYKKKHGRYNWDKLGESLERLKRTAIDLVSIHDYKRYCSKVDEIERVVDNVSDKYFKLAPNAYDFINGNSNFQKLLN